MSPVDATLFAQSCAVATCGTTGGLLTLRHREDGDAALLGVGLLVAAALTAVDAMTFGGHGLPLAAWAILLFGALGLQRLDEGFATSLGSNGKALAMLGVGSAFLLHWVHGAAPLQPGETLGLTFYWLDLSCALALGWLAWARPQAAVEARFLLVTAAAGLATTSLAGVAGPAIAAAALAAAPLPILLRQLPLYVRETAIGAATSFAVALTCALRATTDSQGVRPSLAGLEDPLLLVAALFAAFGVALLVETKPPADLALAKAPAASLASQAPTVAEPAPAATATPAAAATAAPAPSPGSSLPFNTHDLVRDLRTPLTSMLWTAGLMSTSPDERAAHLEALQAHGRKLTDTLADLDSFEALVEGKAGLVEETFDLHQVVQQSLDHVRSGLVDRGTELRIDIVNGTPRWVQGDAARTRQLLSRTLELAAQQATLGPIDVTVCADEHLLHLVALNRSTAAELDERSFTLLFARQLATALGGDLQVRPRPEGGLEFHVTLHKRLAPDWEIDLQAVDADRAAQPAAMLASVSGRVLIVDDSLDHQHLLAHLSTRGGAEVSTAESGGVALHMLESMTFDLVLLDMQMPDLDGHAVVSEMRRRGLATPVIAVSADTAQTDVEACLLSGCNGHLAKPIDPELLQRTLAMHLPAAAK